ncbi:MAG: O-antigen ligase family protein [Deltaproteobacteria bacterium]|nr:O-antigen ligase family protein [Deltaproteobacteria bacterium]
MEHPATQRRERPAVQRGTDPRSAKGQCLARDAIAGYHRPRVRLAIFAVGMLVLLYGLGRDPAWATCAGVYFYFAIPMREYFAPTLPYQAAFFLLGILLAYRGRGIEAARAMERIRIKARDAAEAVFAELKPAITKEISAAALEGLSRSDVQSRASARAKELIEERLRETAPKRLLRPVREAVVDSVSLAINDAATESERLLSLNNAAQRGVLARVVERENERLLAQRVGELLPERLEQALGSAAREDEERSRFEATSGRGPFGLPLPRGALAAVMSHPAIWLHLLYTVATYVSARNARWSSYAAEPFIERCWLLFLPMISLIASARDPRTFRWITWAWMAGAGHLAYNGINLWLRYGGRADDVGGQSGDANFLAIITTSVAPLGLSMFLTERRRLFRWGGLFAAGFYALAVIASGSRGGLLALLTAVGYWFLWTNRKGAAAGILSLGVAAFLVVAPDSFWERMSTMLLPADSNPWVTQRYEASAHSRQLFWAVAIDVFKESPWIGIGPMNYPLETQERGTWYSATTGTSAFMAHNTWLQQLAEYGLFGGSVWIGAYILALLCVAAARRRAKVMKDDPEVGWLPSYLIGFEAGWVGNAVAITFVSCEWLDYNYWIFIWGPLALQIVNDQLRAREWFEISQERPPPRYAPPKGGGVRLREIELPPP